MHTGSHFGLIEHAIELLSKQARSRPNFTSVARQLGVSEFHFHRLFVEYVGVTPKEFLQVNTLQHAKRLLRDSRSLLETSLETGLSGTSRLHDLFLSVECMTPGEYKALGRNLRIYWTVAETPFGPAQFAATDRGLCRLVFIRDRQDAAAELAAEWPASVLAEDADQLAPYVEEVRRRMRGLAPAARLGLLLKGSPLRVHVWQALLRIPTGEVSSYARLAAAVGRASAVRAVASGVAQNPVLYLIPCHRVIRGSGSFGEYRGGAARKAALLTAERAAVGAQRTL